MLDLNDKKYKSYLECRFGLGQRENCADEINRLALGLSQEEVDELIEFNRKTTDIYKLASRDEEEGASQSEVDSLSEYEKLADAVQIPAKYKINMYEYILIGIDKFDYSSTHSLQLIDKMTDNTMASDKARLQGYAMQIKSYQRCCDASVYHNLEKKIDSKIKGKKFKDPKFVEMLKSEFEKLKSNIASPMFSLDEKLEMLQKQLDIEKDCGFGRANFYFKQSEIYTKMADIYSYQKDMFHSEECRAKSDDSLYLARNIMKHSPLAGKNKNGKRRSRH